MNLPDLKPNCDQRLSKEDLIHKINRSGCNFREVVDEHGAPTGDIVCRLDGTPNSWAVAFPRDSGLDPFEYSGPPPWPMIEHTGGVAFWRDPHRPPQGWRVFQDPAAADQWRSEPEGWTGPAGYSELYPDRRAAVAGLWDWMHDVYMAARQEELARTGRVPAITTCDDPRTYPVSQRADKALRQHDDALTPDQAMQQVSQTRASIHGLADTLAAAGDETSQRAAAEMKRIADEMAETHAALAAMATGQAGAEVMPPDGWRVYRAEDANRPDLHAPGCWHYEPVDWSEGDVFSPGFASRHEALEARMAWIAAEAARAAAQKEEAGESDESTTDDK